MLLLHPTAKFRRIQSIEDLQAIANKEKEYSYTGYTAFKDMPKDQVRYVKGSYAIEDGVIHLALDTSRVGSIKLPPPMNGTVSYYGSVMRVDIPGEYTEDSIASHCLAIISLVRLVPSLIPVEVQLHNTIIYSVLRCYSGDSWYIREAQRVLQDVGVWVYTKKED